VIPALLGWSGSTAKCTVLQLLVGAYAAKGCALELLALIYGWFTEGFDTADLQEAKALLDALA
jgi:hypothetical protein